MSDSSPPAELEDGAATQHLQRAAHDLIDAAREVLDALESVIDDPARLRALTSMAADVVDHVEELGEQTLGGSDAGRAMIDWLQRARAVSDPDEPGS